MQRIQFWGMVLAATLSASLTAVAGTAIDTNLWQSASGNWSDGANWSLGHAPKNWEHVIFPESGNLTITIDSDDCVCGSFDLGVNNNKHAALTLTLVGSGTLTTTGYVGTEAAPTSVARQCQFPNWRKFVVNGVRWIGHGKSSDAMYLNSVTEFINGADITIDAYCNLWYGNSSLLVDASKVTFNSSFRYCDSGKFIKITNGSMMKIAATLYHREANTKKIDLSVTNGSTLDIPTSGMQLNAGTSITLTDTSLLRCKKFPDYHSTTVDGITWNLTGGTWTLTGDIATDSLNAYLAKAKGTKFIFDGNLVTSSNSGEIISWKGDLNATGIVIQAATDIRLEDEATLHIDHFQNYGMTEGSTAALMPRIDCRNIVFSGSQYPFRLDGSHKQRYYHLIGPVTMRTKKDFTGTVGTSTTYALLTGDCIVDTTDPDDSSVKHTLNLTCCGARDYATLTIRGGGKVMMTVGQGNAIARFQRVSVEEGTELELLAPFGGSVSGILNTESFSLGANAKLTVSVKTVTSGTAVGSRVNAHKWSIDPTASIVVKDLNTLTNGARAILEGDSTDSLLANAASLVTLEGSPSGWTVCQDNGTVYVSKSTGSVDGTFDHEWTGLGSTRNFSENANWYNGNKPVENVPYVFGAADAYVSPYFNNVWRADGAAGASIASYQFRETAVKAFDITGSAYTIFGKYEAGNTATNWSVSSFSHAPQRITHWMRTIANRLTFLVAYGNLTVGNGSNSAFVRKSTNADDGCVFVTGDLRVNANMPENIQNQLGAIRFASAGTWYKQFMSGAGQRYTVMGSGKTQRFYGQRWELGGCGCTASLAVNDGATLIFNDATTAQDAKFDWGTTSPSISRIDGTLEINIPLVTQVDQFYAGDGILRMNGTAKLSGDGKIAAVGFTDALRVHLPEGDWNTATATTPAGALSIKAEGSPTLFTGGDWRYGVAEGVTATSSAADRALKLEAGATLTLDAAGGKATIDENVTGRGTLAVTNGTLEVLGQIENRIGLEVESGAALLLSGAQTIKSLTAKPGSSLTLGEGVVLAVVGNVDLFGSTVNFTSLRPGRWTRVMTFGGTFKGTDLPVNCEARTVPLATGGFALEVKQRSGLILLFR